MDIENQGNKNEGRHLLKANQDHLQITNKSIVLQEAEIENINKDIMTPLK